MHRPCQPLLCRHCTCPSSALQVVTPLFAFFPRIGCLGLLHLCDISGCFSQQVVCEQAIAALGRALQADPNNPEVLLSLGVSHTNELDQAQALTYLHTWMTTHQQHSQAAATVPAPGDSSQRLSYVIREFEAAAAKVNHPC